MYEHISYAQDGPVALITIERPRGGAIGALTHRELVDAWDALAGGRRRPCGGACAGGGGAAFSAGGDLKSALDGEPVVATDPEERAATARRAPGRTRAVALEDLSKPTIAAVNGAAYAGGLEWVCWTDLAIADRHATLA